ncbi:MAG: alpha-1,2-fucosyltransferase [Pseudanabaenaceae cyanobacterium bins.39]|nr:alpha-1,2-fucosyltransferase [Pseudanabaenaceae cyanobacterium bins.39]
MIIVKLIGGLGNQMFQYATARYLAEKHSTILKLDISGFELYKLHRYSLHCFHVWEYLVNKTEIEDIVYSSNTLKKIGIKSLAKLGFNNIKSNRVITESQFNFDPHILNLPNNILLDGYWQTEKYFVDIADILRREFVVKYQQDYLSRQFADLIQSTQAVSLHVRRADYIQNALTNQIHGTCDRDYYDHAVQYISERVINPHFFIFSDEPQWAKENLKYDFPITIVDCNDASRNYEDLRLMSMCKHNIIANSSFSWWGAWLNPNPHKLVIAPQRWFNDSKINTQDLIPNQWIKI